MRTEEKKANNFTKWFNYMMEELAITYSELSPVIHRGERTIGRYSRGMLPPIKIQEEIFKFICRKSCFKTYHHIDNQNFLRIFRNYCNNLKEEKKISQRTIANALNVSQKTISIYMNPNCNVKFSTETQYKILNTLLSFNMKEIYKPYGEAIYHKTLREFNYLGDYDNYLFGLLQNGTVLSKIDRILKKYIITNEKFIDMNQDFYSILQRQLEACFRYAQISPCSYYLTHENIEYLAQKKSRRKAPWFLQLSHEGLYRYVNSIDEFEKIIKKIASKLKIRIKKQEIPIPPSPETQLEQIIRLHLIAVNQYCFSEKKSVREKHYEQILALIENRKLMGMLFYDIHEIIQEEIPIDARKTFYQQKPFPTAEETAEALCQYSPEVQEIILTHHEAFSDSPLFEDAALSPAGSLSPNHIIYLFLKKIKTLSHKYDNIMEEIGKIAFSGYTNTMIRPDGDEWSPEEIHSRLYALYQSSKCYHDMYQFLLYQDMPELSTNYQGKEHKKDFLKLFEPACKHQNILEIIRCKLKFHEMDWQLWNLLMFACSISQTKVSEVLFKYVNNTEEILDFLYS